MTEDEVEWMCEKYKKGWPLNAMMRQSGRSSTCIRGYLKKRGVYAGSRTRLQRPRSDSGLLYCQACEQEKPAEGALPVRGMCNDCYNSRAREDGKKPHIKAARAAATADLKARKRQLVSTLKQKPCVDCDKTYEYYAMEFDHLHSKTMEIAAMVARHKSDEAILEEVAKAELVCVLCHRNRTEARSNNRQRSMSLQAKKRREGLSFIRSLKQGRPCQDCGEKYSPWQMDFDHRPGETKLYTISKMTNLSRRKILDEVAKCDIVCALCHRRRTHKRGQY